MGVRKLTNIPSNAKEDMVTVMLGRQNYSNSPRSMEDRDLHGKIIQGPEVAICGIGEVRRYKGGCLEGKNDCEHGGVVSRTWMW